MSPGGVLRPSEGLCLVHQWFDACKFSQDGLSRERVKLWIKGDQIVLLDLHGGAVVDVEDLHGVVVDDLGDPASVPHVVNPERGDIVPDNQQLSRPLHHVLDCLVGHQVLVVSVQLVHHQVQIVVPRS